MAVNWFQIGTLSSLVLFALLFFGEGSLADVGDEVNKVGDSIKNAGDKIKDVTIKEAGALWCPIPAAGTKCPSSNVFFYYRCCGTLNSECCLNLQTWFLVVCIGLAVLLAASVLLGIIRCLCCRRNNQ